MQRKSSAGENEKRVRKSREKREKKGERPRKRGE